MHAAHLARLRAFAWMVALAACAPSVQAEEYEVNTNGSAFASPDALAGTPPYCDTDPAAGDQEVCTLQAAVQVANVLDNRDSIVFMDGLDLITLTTGLPSITHPVDIEGNVSGDAPLTAIDAANNGLLSFDNAASLDGGSSVVNLKLMNAGGTALFLDGSPYIVDNLWVGLNVAGTAAAGSSLHGIVVQDTVDTPPPILADIQDLLSAFGVDSFGELFEAFGSNPAGFVVIAQTLLGGDNAVAITNSVISGNGDAGVRIAGGQDTMGNDVLTAGVILAGNRIGTNAEGTDTIPNGGSTTGDGSGVLIEQNAALNFVFGNVIAANEGDGVRLSTGEVDFPNLVAGNFIGLPNPVDLPNPLGLSAENWGNFETGVHVGSFPSAGNASGVAAVVAANFIGFNRCGTWGGSVDDDDGGIAVTTGSDGAILAGNFIGVVEFPPGGDIIDFGNLCDGINISDGKNRIGGTQGADLNVIGANAEDGIFLRSNDTNGNLILGNYIGQVPLVDLAFGNGGHGINVRDSGGNTIGGPGNLDRNVIAHNGGHGIKLFNVGGSTSPRAWSNLLQRNQIFDNAMQGIDLDDPADAPDVGQDDPSRNTAADPTTAPGDAPHAYANWRQHAPILCTGAGGFPCVDGSNNPVGAPPGYAGGTTTVMWSLATAPDADTSAAPEHRYRVEFFSDNGEDGMTFLEEREVTVGPDGRPTGCTDGVCTASMAPTTEGGDPINTAGSQIVATATLITPALARPGDTGNGPANNTSEFSVPAGIPDQIAFAQGNTTVAESDATATIVVSRTGNGSASITLSLADLTTQPADHGALSTTTLTWAVGEAADKTVTIPIVQDAIDEPNQSFELSFVIDASSNGATVGTPATAQVTITDDDASPLLVISALGAAEGDDLVYTVAIVGDSEFPVSVDYAATPEAGTEAADIDASSDPLSGTVTIPAGAGSTTIEIHAVDDAIYEPAEDVRVEMSNPVNGALNMIGGNFAIATIAASDTAPVFNIDSPAQGETDANAPLVFTVTRVGLSEVPASVDYSTVPGSATTPGDYLAGDDPLAGTLAFAATDTQRTVSLVVVGDDLFETPSVESFSVVLANPVDATIGTGTGTATITDDDTDLPGQLRFTSTTFTVDESQATAIVTVERVGGAGGEVSVMCNATDGTAVDGQDFMAGSTLLTWTDGQVGSRNCSIALLPDVLDEADESVALSLTDPTGGATLGVPDAATLTITDNDAPPQVSIQPVLGAFEGDAGDTPFAFSVTLDAPSGLTVSVAAQSQESTPASATSGVDFDAANATLTFVPGDTVETFTVNVNGDNDNEPDETFEALLSAPTNATLGATTLSIATVQNDDSALVGFSVNDPIVAETDVDGPLLAFVVSRSDATLAATIDVSTANGSATAGQDYTAIATTTVNFAAGQMTAPVNVTVLGDNLFEGPETVLLNLTNATVGGDPGAATIVDAQGSGSILDDETTPVLNIADFALAEGDGGSTPFGFFVTLSNPSATDVTFLASTANAGAVAPGDFTALTNQSVTIPAGSVMTTLTVQVVGDTDIEADEDFTLALSAISGANAGDVSAIGDIVNDDAGAAGSVQFSSATYSVGESGVTATITVTRTGGSGGAASVLYGTSDDTATAGSDYVAASGQLDWADGDAADKTFVVMISNDVLDEADETVELELGGAIGATLGAPNPAVLTITDDDLPPPAGALQFSTPTYTVAEAGVQATITVTRTGGALGAISVQYATSNGGATAGSDYTAASGTLNWPDGDAANRTFNVAITNDAIDEGDEDVDLTLSAPTGGAQVGIVGTAVLTIIDDDLPQPSGTLQFSSATYSVAEAGPVATITVTRTGGSSGAASIQYATADGSATAGADYTGVSGTLNWGDGEMGARTFDIPVTNDVFDEVDETVDLGLNNANGAAAGATLAATLTITDDDLPATAGTLQFAPAVYTIGEAGVQATITVSRVGGTLGAISVQYASADGSATAGSDYTASSGQLDWASGDATDKSFNVAITGDAVDELDETVNFTISGATGGAVIGAPAAATLTIVDDDIAGAAGTLQFSAATYTTGEAGVQATITVTRVGGSDGAVSVLYASADGTAIAGSDYTAASGQLDWASGDATDRSFNVAVSNDVVDELDETVALTLSGATGGAVIGAPSGATLTIVDDDVAVVAGTLQFSAATYTVGEAGVQATINVTRVGGSDGAVSVQYASADATAIAGADYTAASGQLDWLAGDATDKTFNVAIADDALEELDETLNLSLSMPTGGAVLGAPVSATLTIVDDDAPIIGIKTFSGPTNPGSGIETIVFTGGGDPCGFDAGTALVATPQPPPAGAYVFPHGVFASTISNCTVGATLSFTITYPQPLPAGSVFWKYGRTAGDPTLHWYLFPANIAGNTATFSITDGGLGDDDLLANGTVVDPSGPAFLQGGAILGPARIVPTMDDAGRWLLMLLVGLVAALALRQRR